MSKAMPFRVKLSIEDTARDAVDRFADGLRHLPLPFGHQVNVTLTQRDEEYVYTVTLTACVSEAAGAGDGAEG